jgi:hypothetical protein
MNKREIIQSWVDRIEGATLLDNDEIIVRLKNDYQPKLKYRISYGDIPEITVYYWFMHGDNAFKSITSFEECKSFLEDVEKKEAKLEEKTKMLREYLLNNYNEFIKVDGRNFIIFETNHEILLEYNYKKSKYQMFFNGAFYRSSSLIELYNCIVSEFKKYIDSTRLTSLFEK